MADQQQQQRYATTDTTNRASNTTRSGEILSESHTLSNISSINSSGSTYKDNGHGTPSSSSGGSRTASSSSGGGSSSINSGGGGKNAPDRLGMLALIHQATYDAFSNEQGGTHSSSSSTGDSKANNAESSSSNSSSTAAAAAREVKASTISDQQGQGGYTAAAVTNITAFKHTLMARVASSFNVQAGKFGYDNWKLFSPVIQCPPDRPLAKYGGEGELYQVKDASLTGA